MSRKVFAGRHRGNPPRYKWCGHAQIRTVENAADTALNEISLLCPSLSISDIQGDVTIEKIRMDLTIRRLLAGDLQGCAYVIAIQKTTEADGLPIEVLNPLNTTGDNFELGNRDILMVGALPVPPAMPIGNGSGSQIARENRLHHDEFNGRRKLHRMNHALTLTVVADTSLVLNVLMIVRVLLRYS